jgi:drug/metabolite transporter (DMT)-like permease
VVISAVILGEHIGPREAIAGAIILAGVYITTRAKARADVAS